ncbi:unnamed protein product, partial [Amoebophrya sp. A120]
RNKQKHQQEDPVCVKIKSRSPSQAYHCQHYNKMSEGAEQEPPPSCSPAPFDEQPRDAPVLPAHIDDSPALLSSSRSSLELDADQESSPENIGAAAEPSRTNTTTNAGNPFLNPDLSPEELNKYDGEPAAEQIIGGQRKT